MELREKKIHFDSLSEKEVQDYLIKHTEEIKIRYSAQFKSLPDENLHTISMMHNFLVFNEKEVTDYDKK